MTRRLVILTEIIAPYRIQVFNALAARSPNFTKGEVNSSSRSFLQHVSSQHRAGSREPQAATR
jgi:hypothetical protein